LDEAACHSPSNETTATGDEYTGHGEEGERERGRAPGSNTVGEVGREKRIKEKNPKSENQLETFKTFFHSFSKQTVYLL
jgi:hypothetical protein